MGRRCANRVRIALGKLTEAARARLFIAPDSPHRITAKRFGQTVIILSNKTGERRGQVIAQTHPLLIIIGEREHPGIGPVDIGQKLAQRVGIFKGRRFQRIKAMGLINGGNTRQHVALGGDLRADTILKAAWFAGLRFKRLLFFILVLSHRRGIADAGALRKRQFAQVARAYSRSPHSTGSTRKITIGSTGTSASNGPPSPVSTIPMASATSMPSTTLPNTA